MNNICSTNKLKLLSVATFCAFSWFGGNTVAATAESKNTLIRQKQTKVQFKTKLTFPKQSLSSTKNLFNSKSLGSDNTNLNSTTEPEPISKLNYFQIAQSTSGKASWYGPKFHGRPTASGEQFNLNAHTAAHPSLPFGTKVKVTNVNNGRSVVVRINDRGPFVGGRIIDLSAAAARTLGLIQTGVAPVRLQILGR